MIIQVEIVRTQKKSFLVALRKQLVRLFIAVVLRQVTVVMKLETSPSQCYFSNMRNARANAE